VPSTQKNKFLFELVRVGLNDRAYYIQTYDTTLGKRWIEALKDNLRQNRVLEKNFCFLGFADSKRNLDHLVSELNTRRVLRQEYVQMAMKCLNPD
jgi:hypothetical protein